MDFKILIKKSAVPIVSDFCQMFVKNKKKSRTLGYKSIGMEITTKNLYASLWILLPSLGTAG